MKKLVIFSALAFSLFTSCDKKIDPILDDEVPDCIVELLNEFKSNNDACEQSGPSVISYNFQNEVVYAFDMGQCVSDGSVVVYNESCVEICTLGTIVGITDCRDEPFDNAVQISVIWEG